MGIAETAIASMRSPKDMHIICIDVTNKCDLACSNYTRLLENQDAYWDMTPENFRLALKSLKGYGGIIAMIGGNPCMHPKFDELCQIFVEETHVCLFEVAVKGAHELGPRRQRKTPVVEWPVARSPPRPASENKVTSRAEAGSPTYDIIFTLSVQLM